MSEEFSTNEKSSEKPDVKTDLKNKFEKLDGNPFFSLFRPYLDFLGKGQIFSLVYLIFAVVNLFLPFVILFQVINFGLFRYPSAQLIFAFILSWLVICFACWISFQLWWDRRKKVTIISQSEFIAIPLASDILQTMGEWLGTLTAIIGAGAGLFTAIFLGNEARYLFYAMGMDYLNFGAAAIFIGPIVGFFIVIIFRIFAELLRIVAALANNTKDIAENLKK